MLFLEHDIEQAMNIKLLLCTFEQLLGLKINFYKVRSSALGKPRIMRYNTQLFFGCKLGAYPFRYLGLPMHYRKLNSEDLKAIEDKIEKRLAS